MRTKTHAAWYVAFKPLTHATGTATNTFIPFSDHRLDHSEIVSGSLTGQLVLTIIERAGGLISCITDNQDQPCNRRIYETYNLPQL
jgi:hypothetical protein